MKERNQKILITIISIAVPALVFSIYFQNRQHGNNGSQLSFLPAFNASINFTVTVLLLAGYYFMKRKQIPLHKYTMITAFCLSGIFLISYVIYHSGAPETHFGGSGWQRPVYFFLLITHIVLAAVILPFILFTMMRGLQSKFDKHRRIAKWTWPLWFYVSLSGVLVYLMLSPYYNQ